jgi:hypothetical protein
LIGVDQIFFSLLAYARYKDVKVTLNKGNMRAGFLAQMGNEG